MDVFFFKLKIDTFKMFFYLNLMQLQTSNFDEVGTLIRHKNWKSKLSAFEIRTQFKVHHLGITFPV